MTRRRNLLPFDMFDVAHTEAEARRARRMESIYHLGQVKVWDGRAVLTELIAKHGRPTLPPDTRRSLARVFAVILWGELAAWKISAQLADRLVPLEAKLAAAGQVHDEARHFYVMHDYLEALGERPGRIEFWAERVLRRTLETDDLLKKLLGMQLTVETIALVIFQRIRELEVEPVLSELMAYYERDESRHVGLGMQLVPQLMADLSVPRAIGLALFQLDLLLTTLVSLKSLEPDLVAIGVDPRSLLGIAYRKQTDIDEKIRAEFPIWPKDPPVHRVFEGMCEALFPAKDSDVHLSSSQRVRRAFDVMRRTRPGVCEQWGRSAPSKKPAFHATPKERTS